MIIPGQFKKKIIDPNTKKNKKDLVKPKISVHNN